MYQNARVGCVEREAVIAFTLQICGIVSVTVNRELGNILNIKGLEICLLYTSDAADE